MQCWIKSLWLGYIDVVITVIILRPHMKVWKWVWNGLLSPRSLSVGCMERSVGVHWSGGRPHRHSGLLHGLQRQEHHPGIRDPQWLCNHRIIIKDWVFHGTRSVIRLQRHHLPCVQHSLYILYSDCVCMPSVSINWQFFLLLFPFSLRGRHYNVFETVKPGLRKLMKQVKYNFHFFLVFKALL